MLFTAPVLGNRAVPIRFRVILAIGLTSITFPLISAANATPIPVDGWMNAVFAELTVGFSLGLGISLVFAAARMTGTVIAQMASIPILEGIDDSSSPVGHMFGMLSIAAFALMNGPELLIASTLDTFVQLPLGTSLETQATADLLIEMLRQSFLLTLRGVAPAVAAMMVSTIVIALISRNYPQINLLSLGLSSNVSMMMIAIFFTLGGCVWLFVDDMQSVLGVIQEGLVNAGESNGR